MSPVYYILVLPGSNLIGILFYSEVNLAEVKLAKYFMNVSPKDRQYGLTGAYGTYVSKLIGVWKGWGRVKASWLDWVSSVTYYWTRINTPTTELHTFSALYKLLINFSGVYHLMQSVNYCQSKAKVLNDIKPLEINE